MKNSRIVVVDYARDASSERLIARIEANAYFDIERTMRTKGRGRGDDAYLVRTNRFRPGAIAVAAHTVDLGPGSEWFTQRATP